MYEVILKFNSGKSLKYKTLNNDLSQYWIENFLLPCIEAPKIYDSSVSIDSCHYSFPFFEEREELVSTLKENIKLIESYGITLPNVEESTFTQDKLNILHEFFHTEVENSYTRYSKDLRLAKGIKDLNYNIHKLESAIGEKSSNKNYAVICLHYYTKFQQDLPKEILNKFNINYFKESISKCNSGNIGFINYSTIGKNIYHAYYNNDIDLIKKGLIRNKVFGENMIQYNFLSDLSMELVYAEKLSKDNIALWLKSHGIENIEEVLTEDTLNQFYPPIVQMRKESLDLYSLPEIYKLFKADGISDCEIKKII